MKRVKNLQDIQTETFKMVFKKGHKPTEEMIRKK